MKNQSEDISGANAIILTTGSTEEVMRMNLYDVAGNLWEWTDEFAINSQTEHVFRVALYMK